MIVIKAGHRLKQSPSAEAAVPALATLQQAIYPDLAFTSQSASAFRERNRLSGHQDPVWSVSFSPDGQTLASASWDSTVKLWDRNGTELATLFGHQDAVLSVSFSPDGQTLASASRDNTVKLWDRNLDNLIAQSCNWLEGYLLHNRIGQKTEAAEICKNHPSPSIE